MAFSSDGMLSTVLLDKVISIDKEKGQVTVQAGARVQQVLLLKGSFEHRMLCVILPQGKSLRK